MAISFSGLASGLDTSSWIESLTNLKRAKVTVFETQREEIVDQRDTLSSIKSFFNSFRSMLEKVTDTKLGIPQMDLFAQNLATSADLTKLTASATTEAQEGNYNIKVDKLATYTEAVSGYRYTTVYEETTTATYGSRLKDIGIKTGNISVTVDGIEKGIHIDENDTLSDLTEKLKGIGVEASYNENTGVFAVNVSIADIHDLGNGTELTGIVDKLHLSGVNEGYRTGTDLQTSSVNTQWDLATEETKLSRLGVKTGHIYLAANDDNYDVEIEANDTVGDLINTLKDYDIDASIEDGIFRISGAVITNETTTDFTHALGLTSVVDENTQQSGNLDHTVTTTTITNATAGTLLSDLGEGVTVHDGDTVIVKNSNNKTSTITVNTTSTLGGLLTDLKNAGLSAQLNNDGIVEISGGTITGGTFDITSALGLQSVPYTAMVTGSALTETTEVFELVTYDTKLVEDLHVKKGYMKVTDEDGQVNYLKIKTGETIQNLMADLAGLGISSVLGEDGVLTITGGAFESLTDAQVTDLFDRNVIVDSDPSYKQGTDLLYLLTGGDTFNSMQTRVASSSARTMALRVEHTNTNLATATTELGTLGLAGDEDTIFSVRGEERTVAVTTTMTIQGLLDAMNNAGISASFNSETGKIAIDNAIITSPSGAGSLSDVLNLETTISGKYVQSNQLYNTQTTTIQATSSTTLRELGLDSTQTIQICNSTGVIDSVTVNGDSTLGTIVNALQNNTIAASVTEGKLNITGGFIVNSAVESALGLVRSEDGTSRVVGAYLTTTSTVQATGSTTLEEVMNAKGSFILGEYNLAFNGLTIDVNSNTTIDNIIAQINSKGGDASIDSSGTLRVNGGALTGNVADALMFPFGITTTVTIGVSATGNTATTTEVITADRTTKFNQIGIATSGTTTAVVHNSVGIATTTITVLGTDTIGSFFDQLNVAGISANIQNGVITFNSTDHKYMDGALASSLGVNVQHMDNYVESTTQTATGTVTWTHTENAGRNNTLAEVGKLTSGTANLIVYNKYDDPVGTVTVSSTTTVGSMLDQLGELDCYGNITEGVVTINSSNGNYVTGNMFGSGNVGSVTLTYAATDPIDENTILGDFGVTNGSLIVHKANGTTGTITVDNTESVGALFNKLSSYDISAGISNGKVTMYGNGDLYVTAGTSNVVTQLKIGTPTKTTTSATINSSSAAQSYVVTVAADKSTKLSELKVDANAPSGYQVTLSVSSSAGTRNATINFTSTSTVNDVIDELAKYDLNLTMDSTGKFTLSSDKLSDFTIGGTLGKFIMGENFSIDLNPTIIGTNPTIIGTIPTKTYNTTINNTTDLNKVEVNEMSASTKLSDIGVTSGNIVISQDSVLSTIAIDSTTTVGEFQNQLYAKGINSSISSGRLSITDSGVTFFTTPASGTSNILDIMGINKSSWTMGEYSQVSKDLQDTNTTVVAATVGKKLSELTDASGNSLGITSGQIYAYENGTRNTVNISADDTISSLSTKLARYGITLGMSSDGTIYLDGNDNSYLSTDGLPSGTATNLLTKIGISSASWQTNYDSLSQALKYTTTSDDVIDGNTKLTSLKDDSGNNLGITTGTYELYNNGVRSTETIGANTTVDDLFSILTANGMTANIGSDGSINIGANSKSFLATSAGAGASNLVDVLIDRWNFVNIYETNHLEKPENITSAISRTTKLADIEPTGRYQEGYITVVKDGIQTDIYLAADVTVGSLMDELSLYGFDTTVNGNGQLIVKNSGNSTLQNYGDETSASNALEILGITAEKWITTNFYDSSNTVQVIKTSTFNTAVTDSTALSELGVTTGEYYVYKDGIRYTALISSDETFGSFVDTLSEFGLQASLVNKTGEHGESYAQLTVLGSGNTYVATSKSKTNASNVVTTLFPSDKETMYKYEAKLQTSTLVTTWTDATQDTKLSYFNKNGKTAEGTLSVNVDGVTNNILITADETFGTLINKLADLGVNATLNNGQFTIESGYVDFTINSEGTTSGLVDTIGMRFETDMGGYCASTAKVEQTVTVVEDKSESIVKYANYDTEMSLLNISKGTFSVYRDGQKATIEIEEGQTFNKLRMDLAAAFGDVDMVFEDGIMKIYSTTEGVKVNVGATNDTSNISSICGFIDRGEDYVTSSRELYCVNGGSKLTQSGLFKKGTVTEGQFVIGDETFTIDENTTLNDLIAQINYSNKSNATAYWDSVDGKLVIKSRSTGASLVNIEAVTSNFTDVMGFTTTEWNADNTISASKLNINSQELGQNSSFSINGTQFTSSSNTVTSDVSKIMGVTINLKDVTEGSTVQLKIEKDKESVANAVSNIVDSYNELIENVEAEVSATGSLKGESGLKMLKNQIRSLMTSSLAGSFVFKNLSAVGISTEAASAGNISTTNISKLKFDKDKFISAFDSDLDSLKQLLVGTEDKKGVLVQVEEAVENALASVYGYFSTAENSMTKKITNYNNKIDKANAAVESYRARLEAKFSSMDLLISKMQNQYSSFLTG